MYVYRQRNLLLYLGDEVIGGPGCEEPGHVLYAENVRAHVLYLPRKLYKTLVRVDGARCVAN